jgi:hypothetical protein
MDDREYAKLCARQYELKDIIGSMQILMETGYHSVKGADLDGFVELYSAAANELHTVIETRYRLMHEEA